VTSEENGKKVTREEKREVSRQVALESSRIQADFHVDYRQKGLLWFSTYRVVFEGKYGFRNPTSSEQAFQFQLPLPAKEAVYDGLELSLDGRPLPLSIGGNEVTARATIPAGAQGILKTAYHSQGQRSWRYRLGGAANDAANSGQVSQQNDFHMLVQTDFSGFDFPENALSPTTKRQTGNGWEWQWDYQNLISGFDIALKMPEKLQPGPLAGQISYFAPVSLFFFFFVIFYLVDVAGNRLAPHELFFSGRCILFFPLVVGISGGSRFDPCGVCAVLGGINPPGRELFAVSRESTICHGGCRIGAIDLSSAFFVCVLLRRIYRAGNHNWGNPDVVCGDAADRADSMGREVW
jgi:hypothetical protein